METPELHISPGTKTVDDSLLRRLVRWVTCGLLRLLVILVLFLGSRVAYQTYMVDPTTTLEE